MRILILAAVFALPALAACVDDYEATGAGTDAAADALDLSCRTQGCPAGQVCDDDGVCRSRVALGAVCVGDSTCTTGHCVDGVCCATACGTGDACVKAYADADHDGFGTGVGTPTYQCASAVGDGKPNSAIDFAPTNRDCDDADPKKFPGQTLYFSASSTGYDFDCDAKETPAYVESKTGSKLTCGICECLTSRVAQLCFETLPRGFEGTIIRQDGACACGLTDDERTYIVPAPGPVCGTVPLQITRCDNAVTMGACETVTTNKTGATPCR